MATLGIETLAQVATAAAAVAALIISVRAESRNQKRFDQQLDEARKADERNQERFDEQRREAQLVEERNQQRFEEQLQEAHRIAAGNAKPLLALSVEAYGHQKSLILHNHGPGTAVVTYMLARRVDTGKSSREMGDLVEKEGRAFAELSSFSEPYYLAGKDQEVLIRLTKQMLVEEAHKTPNEADEMLVYVEGEIDEIELEVSYEDILGNIIAERLTLK